MALRIGASRASVLRRVNGAVRMRPPGRGSGIITPAAALGIILLLVLMPGARGEASAADAAVGADVHARIRIVHPPAGEFRVTLNGHRHAGEPWSFPDRHVDLPAGQWSDWIDVSDWPWHGRMSRSGGVAEWPSMRIALDAKGDEELPPGCTVEVELADRPAARAVVIRFVESSRSRTIGFLVPTPLRQHAEEFETGSQMVARHLRWAREITGGKPIALEQFDLCTALAGQYDPGLAEQALETVRLLGLNIVNDGTGLEADAVRAAGFRLYRQMWAYEVNPERADRIWGEFVETRLKKNLHTEIGRWEFRDGVAHWVLGDEIRSHARFYRGTEADEWFRGYLRRAGIGGEELGIAIDQARYPTDLFQGKPLPRDGSLADRRLLYHAARFAQSFSTASLRHTSDLIHQTLPGAQTETLPTSHGFFGDGMSSRFLDFFEIGRQRAVDQLSAEDWLGLNHMYGPDTTHTGAQTLAYLCAVMRSSIQDRDMLLRTLITPSDDRYLRLKAYSALGQGARSIFYWAFGPTYISTENYWSDLRSMYQGIAKVSRAIRAVEPVLMQAKPVRDPVAVLYSVSHDIWHDEDPVPLLEKRLLWHALRHLSVQPDFLDEQQLAAGALENYRVLYVTDWCISRRASAAIEQWVRDGGIVYLSAGAALRDEFYEPYMPPFAQAVWPADATERLINERRPYNERYDLPTTPAMTRVRVRLNGGFELPVIGCRLEVRNDLRPTAQFVDGAPAAGVARHGKGHVFAVGFMPMVAYCQLANFKPTTLEEKWPPQPRELVMLPLRAAKMRPVAACNVPVVEPSLLSGRGGSVLVLANYAYEPIRALTVDLKLPAPISSAVSTEGVPVHVEPIAGGVRLRLPLQWTDMILLKP